MREGEFAPVDLRIAYGICLRRLGEWTDAQQVFYRVALECGRNGRFTEQARALVEWGVVAKYQGNYEQALGLFSQAKRFAQRTQDDDLLRALTLQEVQIVIQQGRAEDAVKLLAALPETGRVLALQSEAQLVLGDYAACQMLAERALRLIGDDPATETSLYTIMGRSCERRGDHARARGYFTDVVTLLERSDDAFSLARAQTNLAAVLIPMGRYPDAGMLLARAEQVQARLGDQVGLNATRHNRSILGGYIAR